ncbi:MAG: hypothetical protein O2894_14095 [Planctomycetota bacterium]|nr:hypothetical protein [Planctomycetota bacterium]
MQLRSPRASVRAVLGCLCVLAVTAAFTLPARAGDEADGPKDASKVSKGAHLRFQVTYEGALLEARIRNLPIFVSRHKDF